MRKVLIADDEEIERRYLANLFEKHRSEYQLVGEARNGKEIMDLVDLAKEAKQLDPNYVYDGELLANTVGHSKDVYRDTMSIVGSDNIKTNVIYNVFDKVPRTDFESGFCDVPTLVRKESITNEITCDKFFWIRNVPMLYVGDNQDRIQEYLKWAKDNGKDIDWTDIQARYDLYNEYFYSTRKDD